MKQTRLSTAEIKKRIECSLLELMDELPYENINIKDICLRAGVGRTSFYRHYNNVDEILISSFKRMWIEWNQSHNIKKAEVLNLDTIMPFVEYSRSISHYVDLVFKNGLDTIFISAFEFLTKAIDRTFSDYERSFFTSGLYGILKQWWKNGFTESTEYITDIIKSFYIKMYH